MYVLIAGVTNIGEAVRGVYSSREKAEEALITLPSSNMRYKWQKDGVEYKAHDEYALIEEIVLDEVPWSDVDREYDNCVNLSKDDDDMLEKFGFNSLTYA